MHPIERTLDQFMAKVRTRLVNGARVYGDVSLKLPTPRLIDEIQQELEDVSGWSVLLWAKLERLRKLTIEAGARVEPEDDGA